jgi:hypothetical protein
MPHDSPAPDTVKRLVDLSACNAQADRFDRDRKACPARSYGGVATRSRRVFPSPDYKEEQLRAVALVVRHSTFGVRNFLEPVIHEESIKVAGATKAPDYTFRIDGHRVFFAEVKKPLVNVAEDEGRACHPLDTSRLLTQYGVMSLHAHPPLTERH